MYSDESLSAADVVDALIHHLGTAPNAERRMFGRKAQPTGVTVFWGPSEDRSTLDVLAHDVSERGCGCFAVNCPPTGAEVLVRFNSLPTRPTLTGVVRYHNPIACGFHRIGIEFPQSLPGPAPVTVDVHEATRPAAG